MKHVEIFTDGACEGNPGPGGWGAILRYGAAEREICGASKTTTTNNRMELTAVIEALNALKEPCSVTLTTDSRYVVDGMSNGWAKKWRDNGWRKPNKSPALNSDLWEILLNMSEVHDIKFVWIKGHNGHPENERCDAMATSAYQRMI